MRIFAHKSNLYSWRFGPSTKYPEGDYYLGEKCVERSSYSLDYIVEQIRRGNQNWTSHIIEIVVDPDLEMDEGL